MIKIYRWDSSQDFLSLAISAGNQDRDMLNHVMKQIQIRYNDPANMQEFCCEIMDMVLEIRDFEYKFEMNHG